MRGTLGPAMHWTTGICRMAEVSVHVHQPGTRHTLIHIRLHVIIAACTAVTSLLRIRSVQDVLPDRGPSPSTNGQLSMLQGKQTADSVTCVGRLFSKDCTRDGEDLLALSVTPLMTGALPVTCTDSMTMLSTQSSTM